MPKDKEVKTEVLPEPPDDAKLMGLVTACHDAINEHKELLTSIGSETLTVLRQKAIYGKAETLTGFRQRLDELMAELKAKGFASAMPADVVMNQTMLGESGELASQPVDLTRQQLHDAISANYMKAFYAGCDYFYAAFMTFKKDMLTPSKPQE